MTDHVDPRIEAAAVDRISHNHGPEEGEGMACRTHPTGDCVIRALTARAEAAEAKIAAVRELREGDLCSHCLSEVQDALDGTA